MKFGKFIITLSAIFIFGGLSACQGGGSGGTGSVVHPLSDNTVILEYAGGKITAKDVQKEMAPMFKKFQEESFENYQQAAKSVLVRKLVADEAKKKGMTEEEFVNSMMQGAQVTDAEVAAFIKERKLEKGVMNPNTKKMEPVKPEMVKSYLSRQKQEGAQQNLIGNLMAQANVKTVLELPRIQIDTPKTSPFAGGENAKVVIQEFSDFQCPYCSKAKNSVSQIKEAYGDKVKILFRHFPLDFHPEAKPAALASICANMQGKFWEFHDKVFDNQPELKSSVLPSWGKEVGLDIAKWEECQKSPEASKILQGDLEQAEKIGVNSTPTFYINGKKVAGALSFQDFKNIIDGELKKL